jgi:two-component system, sensor histidine kinase and response regulator
MPDSTKTRILIIDDDIGFRDLLRIHLSSAGYQVQVADDGVTGGRALLEHPPDLIVSDVNMPFLDGFELLSLLRADAETAAIPVILLSGRSDGDTMAKAVELGAADFLTKPVTRDQLLESIEACLSRNKARTSNPDYGSTPPV